MEQDFYSIREFAEKLGVSSHTIRRAIKAGRISVIRVGGSDRSAIRIPAAEISRMGIIEMRKALQRLIDEEKEDRKCTFLQ